MPSGTRRIDGPERRFLETAEEVWCRAALILKVKEPLDDELELMRPGQVLFTYLHLAASKMLTEALMDRGIVGIGYETVQLEDGTLPLLVPMSEVAGRLSIQAGATSLEMISGGKGLLLPGVSGVRRGRVTIVGAGIVGFNACVVGVGFGADVTIIDINPLRLAYVRDVVQGHVTTLMSTAANIEEAVGAGRPRDLCRADPRRQNPTADQAEAPDRDGTGVGARRRGGRPGWLYRDQPADHSPRPPVISRGRHRFTTACRTCPARCPHNVDLRVDQCHDGLRARGGQPRMARRGG